MRMLNGKNLVLAVYSARRNNANDKLIEKGNFR